ncbi:pentatricopeptide repeat-containing protein [Salix suchowensis]|nr:pentatricopeptide repeat-containing protein [Salix suchowensis]
MTPIANSRTRAIFGRNFFFNVNSQDQAQLLLALRHYSSSNGEQLDAENVKEPRKSSNKSKTAKSMARLINSKPWSTELESSLFSLSPSISKTTFFQVLRFIASPSKAFDFFNWASRNGFTHDGRSYFMMLEILGRNGNLNIARNFLFSIERRSNGSVKIEDRFCNTLLRSYGNAGLFNEAIKLFSLMKSSGVSPSVVTFNSLLLILLKRGRTNMAHSVFDEMCGTYGVTPDTYTFNILIRGFCKNSLVDVGFRFFKEMSRFNCEPDVVTYNTLVDGLCRAGKVRIAHNVSDVVTYTTLVRGYCMKQEIDEALVVFKEMASRGLKPNDITYNTLIKGLCEVQKFDKIKEILGGAVGGRGFVPDTCTYNTLMNAQCDAGNLDEALKMFKKMKELKVQPDSATYSVLIRNLCQRGDFERAEQLFDELSDKEILLRDDGCTPLVAAYNPIFDFLCKNGKTCKAERVFRQLMKKGTQDPPSYKTLIIGHCKEGTFEAGYKLLHFMLRRDYVPDFETYVLLINGFVQKGEPILAYRTLERMLKSSYLPKTSVFHSVLSELLKNDFASESASLVVLMIDRKIRQDINLSTHTVRLLFGSELRIKAFQIVELLYDNGYVVDMEELIGFICQNGKLLDAQKILSFCLEKGHNVDINVCNVVIEALCKMKRPLEAFGLYYKLVEKGNHQQLSCLEGLRTALEAGGRSEEAKFVSKRMPNERQLTDL